jgi:hypothetical protein
LFTPALDKNKQHTLIEKHFVLEIDRMTRFHLMRFYRSLTVVETTRPFHNVPQSSESGAAQQRRDRPQQGKINSVGLRPSMTQAKNVTVGVIPREGAAIAQSTDKQ